MLLAVAAQYPDRTPCQAIIIPAYTIWFVPMSKC